MKHMKKIVAAIMVAGLAAAPAAALAGGGFDACDKNHDGKLTLEEFKACHPDPAKAEEEFKWYDRNHDGVVTKAEYEGRMKK